MFKIKGRECQKTECIVVFFKKMSVSVLADQISTILFFVVNGLRFISSHLNAFASKEKAILTPKKTFVFSLKNVLNFAPNSIAHITIQKF